MAKDKGKFVGDADEANAIVKAMRLRGAVPQPTIPVAPPAATTTTGNPAAPTQPAGVGGTFVGADGVTYEVVEEIIATGEEHVDLQEPGGDTREEDE